MPRNHSLVSTMEPGLHLALCSTKAQGSAGSLATFLSPQNKTTRLQELFPRCQEAEPGRFPEAQGQPAETEKDKEGSPGEATSVVLTLESRGPTDLTVPALTHLGWALTVKVLLPCCFSRLTRTSLRF